MPDRVILFLDYQNVYKGARETFHEPSLAPGRDGQIDPLRLGTWLIENSRYERELTEVRIYRGRPSASRDPKGHSAFSRQRDAWERDPRVTCVFSDLRYPRGWPDRCAPGAKPQEKGVDVALAIDYVRLALQDRYDVGILMSTDTDLKPAIATVAELRSSGGPRVEVAGWKGPGAKRPLLLPEVTIWCHWLDKSCYEVVRDPTRYNAPF
ncbi:NYN domain-containing protein [Herbidospora sp. NEAU-GS84]|uniref:NYN domain-containing protein n=1 Tax=Herbidospora solisilvae TaxID=2696284 RepID=A0A7C9J4X9_9ACTN|nr:NYN domain-containing protein [Herbidospora solisilvae]NAS24766.1 NYN domain-containing protein [Herbidospora solisilvae]